MVRERVNSPSPYEEKYGFCRALRFGDRIEVAGTGPIGPDGKTVEGDASVQATRCFEIALEAIEKLGGQAHHVTRTRMYIVDPADADAVGTAHREAFGSAPPPATLIVARLLDPAWRVEVEVEASL